MNNDLLIEQKNYYRARAAEYDDWWFRRGRYDRGATENHAWFAEAEALRQAVKSLGRCKRTVELACGTGLWTELLAGISDELTALDASPEMLALARSRVPSAHVRWHVEDLFAWQPQPEFDLAFAGFWFSHVPPDRLDKFLGTVSAALRPGGRLLIVDSLYDNSSTARDHQLGEREQHWQSRRLTDGREFRVVKVFYDPAVLKQMLEQHGFDAEVNHTGRFFFQAAGTKR